MLMHQLDVAVDEIEMGMEPGPEFRGILDAVYEMQMDGKVSDLDGAIAAARELQSAEPSA